MADPARVDEARQHVDGRAHPRRALPGLTVLAALAAALLIGGAAPADAGPATPGGAVTLDRTHCARLAPSMPSGPEAFRVTNPDEHLVSVYLVDPSGAEVFGELVDIQPTHTETLTAIIAPGRYALRCVYTDNVIATSNPYTVTGAVPPGAAPGTKPMQDLAMVGPINAYRAYVAAALPKFLAACKQLDSDVDRGDLPAARAQWLVAHLDYERLGAAYNSFGDFDGQIDPMAQGLPQGPDTPGWTGLFAIEYELWHGSGAKQLPTRVRPLTRRLVSDVSGLIQDFPSEDIDPSNLPLRAHEILENALQFQLTGIADYGSGTTLATLYANTQGTQAVVDTLRPLISPRDPAVLSSIDAWTARVQGQLTALRSPDGTWTPLTRLSTTQRQRLDASVDELLEQLSVLPGLLAPRTSA